MPTTWGDIIDNLDSEHFVGRREELSAFSDNLNRTQPRYLIFYIYGQGGIGKTALLNQYKEIAREYDYVIADSDDQQGNIPLILSRFAKQVSSGGEFSLEKFTEKYKLYQQLKQEIENDPNAPQGLASFVGQSIVKVGFAVADEVPVLRQSSKLIDQDLLSTQAGEWLKYLASKWSNKHDEISLIREPVPILTKTFFDELNILAEKEHVFLCFDNYEITRSYIDPWLTQIRDYNPSSSIKLGIASRTPPGPKWEHIKNVVASIRLRRFTDEEAEKYLDYSGIVDSQRREEILEFSGKLPILMSWLAAPDSDDPDPSLPTADIVDRFLRWVEDPTLRAIALDAAIPRILNIDVLQVVDKENNVSIIEERFDWLRSQPFVLQRFNGWQYHDVVRQLMIKYQEQRSKNRYQGLHRDIANFYLQKCEGLQLDSKEKWNNELWQEYLLEYIYHLLVESTGKNWPKNLDIFVLSIKYKFSLSQNII